jgi:hypothetical protein
MSVDADVSIQQWNRQVPLKIDKFAGIDPLRISEIAPAAVHIKELNNIDPITLEPLRVNEVRNIDPIIVEKFVVTHLPTVNLSVRQLPALDMHVKRLPPLSVGFHQNIHIPSDYTVRARFFGVEFFRVTMSGNTTLIPRDNTRREQSKTHEQSFPETATAGNPAIPSKHSEMTSVRVSRVPHFPVQPPHHHHLQGQSAYHGVDPDLRVAPAQGSDKPQSATWNSGSPPGSFALISSSQSSEGTLRSEGVENVEPSRVSSL